MPEVIDMSLGKLAYCPRTTLPVLILESADGSCFLPVFVSYPEWGLLTHPSAPGPWLEPALWPVVEGFLEAFRAEVREVFVERRDSLFLSRITVGGALGQRVLTTRAGEGIALALRTGAPIRARRDQVLTRGEPPRPGGREEDDSLLQWVSGARPRDFSL